VNFIIKIADKKKSQNSIYQQWMVGMGGWGPDSISSGSQDQTSSLPLDFLTQSSKLLTH
jgi:hypothetical protein